MNGLSYIVIESWMISDLGLSGNNLLVYALLYGFSRDGESSFFGSYGYIKRATGISSSKTITNVLTYLIENKLILKDDHYMKTGKSNGYKVVLKEKLDFVRDDEVREKKLKDNSSFSLENRVTYDDILNDFAVKDDSLRNSYFNFIKHCQINKRIVTNDKLERLIVKLDLMYGNEDCEKIKALNLAIDKGYFDIKDERV